jgi:hypothetical protein
MQAETVFLQGFKFPIVVASNISPNKRTLVSCWSSSVKISSCSIVQFPLLPKGHDRFHQMFLLSEPGERRVQSNFLVKPIAHNAFYRIIARGAAASYAAWADSLIAVTAIISTTCREEYQNSGRISFFQYKRMKHRTINSKF